jgi:hypothetical protein
MAVVYTDLYSLYAVGRHVDEQLLDAVIPPDARNHGGE